MVLSFFLSFVLCEWHFKHLLDYSLSICQTCWATLFKQMFSMLWFCPCTLPLAALHACQGSVLALVCWPSDCLCLLVRWCWPCCQPRCAASVPYLWQQPQKAFPTLLLPGRLSVASVFIGLVTEIYPGSKWNSCVRKLESVTDDSGSKTYLKTVSVLDGASDIKVLMTVPSEATDKWQEAAS